MEYLALSPQRQAFIDALLIDPRPAEAGRSAHYATPNEGVRLLRIATVQEAYDAEREIARKESGVTLNSVLVRLDALADDAPMPRDRIRALELVGKLLGGFVKRVQVSGVIAHIPALPGMTDEDLTDLVAELRARRDGVALPAGDADADAIDGEARVVDEDEGGESQ